ncbi:MAG TPA: hypothetical protein VF406_14265 [Thermodesulfobacteriota bacterium]
MLVVVFLFLLSEVLGGAIRYGFARVGLIPLVYLPKALLAVALAARLALDLARGRTSAAYLAALALLTLGAAHGYLALGHPAQPAFGLWVLIPFLAGIVALPALASAGPRVVPYAAVLWAIAAGGVLLNAVHQWPWMGFVYRVAGTEIEGSRLWQTGGFVRLAGFSRASFDAATQILLLATVAMVWARGPWRLAVWLLSGVAIALTTAKMSFGVYLVLSLFWLTHRLGTRELWRLVPVGAAAIAAALPFSTLLVEYDFSSAREDPIRRLLFASIGDRVERMWPDTLETILTHGNWLFGRGVGGIGMAQQYFEPVLYSPADNLVVYLYALFGVVGIGSVVLYALGLMLLPLRDRLSRLVFAFGVSALLAGVTANALESALLALGFGASLRYATGTAMDALAVAAAGTDGPGRRTSAAPGRPAGVAESPGRA